MEIHEVITNLKYSNTQKIAIIAHLLKNKILCYISKYN